MKLRVRNGYYWVEGKYTNVLTGKRERLQKTTGILADGTISAKRTADLIAEQIVRSAQLAQGKTRRMTVADAFNANLARKRLGNRSEATLAIVGEKRAHVVAAFGEDRDLRTIDAEVFVDYAVKAREAGRAPATVLRELRELAIGMKALGLTPPPMPDLGRTHTPRERWLTTEETRALLPYVPSSRREHVLAYRLLGVRKSELFRISAVDVDVAAWSVRVRGTKTEGADRWIPVHPELRPIFLRRMQESPKQLFPDWRYGNADRDLRKAAEKAGLGPISFNDLRRSFAMELLRAGVPTRDVAEALGHSSTRMVESHYARLRPGHHLTGAIAKLQGGYVDAGGLGRRKGEDALGPESENPGWDEDPTAVESRPPELH